MIVTPTKVAICSFAYCSLAFSAAISFSAEIGKARALSTTDGVAFAILGEKPANPAPTLFIFALDAERTLNSSLYRRAGNHLIDKGYLCISVDLPCHGAQRRSGEAAELKGWAQRVVAGEDIMAEFTGRTKKVLDYLIAEKYTDPNRVAACGTSRGGFSAIHFAAADPRVKCAVGYSPVTDLAALREYRGNENLPLVKSLSLANNVDRLADRAVYVAIGDRDERVGTDEAIEFARALSAMAAEKKLPGKVDLHVCPAAGHNTPEGAAEQAAKWIEKVLETN